ncbi:hypothetical protein LUZ63_000552 [Rhynchospora breviuscula]|uniref:non-specific serine/threonine protein kinase n=1 Tax=Rhynchospora breviuscula TaxID=2022672 RepID=A0A9Q0CVK9_9POAL|nr:hypothetical protein LUZ63_000552 [Rhynchospora breviuscula]
MASLRGNPLLSSSSILFLCLLSLLSSGTSTDTITSNSSLSGTSQKLTSAQGKFALGFYQPTNSSYWYIAIWYNTISVRTPVFIANRNAPVTDPATSQLTIGTDGNMVLINGSKTEVWSTNVTGINPSNKTQAVLDDNGNLVLSYVSNTSNVLWQSIDNPTDTWLPGGKLGLNKTTGMSQRLISWKSSADPAEGAIYGTVVCLISKMDILQVMERRRDQREARLLKESRGTLIAFRYDDLQYVTKNFSVKLGGGAFGSVYKGLLPDSTAIAVKRLDGFHQGEKQFRAEVSTIGTIQHVNLVRLIGFCSEASCRLLVYEYMPNSSLDTKLFNTRDALLNWTTRYQIALGTARGLAYLHEKCRDCIIHCDIKPENILLDDNLVPKVADFGLSKLLGRDFSRVLTTMRGTRGYLAPEWITGVPITPKADVFSYGMMLFEIISGHRNNSDQGDGKLSGSGFFPTFAARKLIEGDVQTLLDQKLNGEAPIEELESACKVACWCIQDDETTRPTMGQVVQILEGILEVNTPPMPMSLRVMGESPDYINFFSDMSSSASSKTRSTSAASSLVKNSS